MSFSNKVIEQPAIIVKVVFIGDSGVGKTSLISREFDNSFTEQHLATIGVDFRMKNYDLGLLKIKAQLWDTAGQERFRSIQKPYYKSILELIIDAKAVCLCFSLANRQSFVALEKWINELVTFDVPRDQMVLIGCKSDLDVEVATDEILVFAQKEDIQYFQTSSLTGEGVNDAFNSIMVSCAQKEIQNSQLNVNRQSEQQNAVLRESKIMSAKKNCC